MPRLLLVTRYFPPTNIVGAIRPSRLAKHAARSGWSVDVIHGPHDFNTIEAGTAIQLPERVRLHEVTKGRSSHGAPSLRKRLLRRVERLALEALGTDTEWRLSRSAADTVAQLIIADPDRTDQTVLITTSPPHSLQSVGLRVRSHCTLPWIVDLRDPWDKYTLTGEHCQPNVFERRREAAVMETADSIVSSTSGYTEILRGRFPHLDPGKFATITNSFADGEITDLPHAPSELLTVVYTGIFYPKKDPYTFFRAVAHWRKTADHERQSQVRERLRIKLVGVEDSVTAGVVSELGLSDVVEFVPRVPQAEARRLCHGADFLLIAPGLTDTSREGWLPSKVFEYLNCRKPIIAICRKGQLSDLIDETDSGYVFQNEDPDPIVALLDDALTAKISEGRIATRCSFRNISQFSESNMAARFLALATSLLDRR